MTTAALRLWTWRGQSGTDVAGINSSGRSQETTYLRAHSGFSQPGCDLAHLHTLGPLHGAHTRSPPPPIRATGGQ